jgi:predicted Na+-dependent transporter
MCIKLLRAMFKSPAAMLLAARYKLGTNEIDIVNNVVLALLGPTELAHVMAQLCEAQTIKAEEIDMKMQLDSSG